MIVEIGGGLFSKRITEEIKKKNIKIIFVTTSLKNLKFKNKIKSFPVIHYTGSPTVTFTGVFSLLRFLFWKKKIVVSWIGFDIRRVQNNIFWKIISKIFVKTIDVHITDDEFVSKELNQVGIPAKVQPLPVYSMHSLCKLPEKKRILVYLPDPTLRDFEHYQGHLIIKLVKEFPKTEFLITRNSGQFFKNDENVKCISWANNLKECYENSIAVIRLPLHDATGATIIETLSMGRTMIASGTNFPFCKIVNNFDDLKNHVKDVLNNPTLNAESSQYVHDVYNNSKFADDLIKICKNII